MAILVRATYQTRFFEDRFIKIGLPYKIIGGTKFYERLRLKTQWLILDWWLVTLMT